MTTNPSLEESNLRFTFKNGVTPIKFDDTAFYKKHFNALAGSKGIDFIAFDETSLYLIEVKNFEGHEIENKTRLRTDSKDSISLEVAQKVRDSLSCLLGAYRKENDILTPYFQKLISKSVQLKVILFLEGNFPNKEKDLIPINEDLKMKLRWLTAKVLVENIKTNKGDIYSVQKIGRAAKST